MAKRKTAAGRDSRGRRLEAAAQPAAAPRTRKAKAAKASETTTLDGDLRAMIADLRAPGARHVSHEAWAGHLERLLDRPRGEEVPAAAEEEGAGGDPELPAAEPGATAAEE